VTVAKTATVAGEAGLRPAGAQARVDRAERRRRGLAGEPWVHPRLVELGSGWWINALAPEDAARVLRES